MELRKDFYLDQGTVIVRDHFRPEQILPILQRESVRRLLVGVPLNMDDTLGLAARNTIAWAKDLASRANLPLVLVDERGRKRGDPRLFGIRRDEPIRCDSDG